MRNYNVVSSSLERTIKMNELKLFSGTEVQPAVTAGLRNAMLRQAYMHGFRDAMNFDAAEQDVQPVSAAAMVFGFLCWVAMLFFVFR